MSVEASSLDFELLFRSAPSLLLVLEAGSEFRILAASDAYLRAARVSREAVLGRGFFEVFPEEDAQGSGRTGAASSRAALERVLVTRAGDGFNVPVVSADGRLRYIIHRFDAMEPEVLRRARERDDAVQQLEAVGSEAGAFVQLASEGLRVPLRAIESFCRLFEKMRAGSLDDGNRRLLSRILSQVNRMDTIIEGLLGLSRSTRAHMARRRVDLAAIAQRLAAQWRAREPERNVIIRIGEPLEAFADESLLGIVLENLFANAWKFTGPRKEACIEIGSRSVAGQNVYYVRDNGVGFDIALAHKLFAPFVRLHDSSDFAGHGIGLATVKRIIERHGGEVWAEAQLGRGATFHFTLGAYPAA